MRKYVMLCRYSEDGPTRHSNPLDSLPRIEVVGPFDTAAEASKAAENKYEFCEEHWVQYLLEPVNA